MLNRHGGGGENSGVAKLGAAARARRAGARYDLRGVDEECLRRHRGGI
jgi:hypothetical protein